MESEAAAPAAAQEEGSVSSPNTSNNERSLSPIITPFNHSSLIGKRVAKTFDGVIYEGEIIRYCTNNGWGIDSMTGIMKI